MLSSPRPSELPTVCTALGLISPKPRWMLLQHLKRWRKHHPSIFCTRLSCAGSGGLEHIPAHVVWAAEYTLNRAHQCITDIQCDWHTDRQPLTLTFRRYDCRQFRVTNFTWPEFHQKPEHPEDTHTDTHITYAEYMQTPHTEATAGW